MRSKNPSPSILINDESKQSTVDDVPFSPPIDGFVDFGKFLNFKSKINKTEIAMDKNENQKQSDAQMQQPLNTKQQLLRISLLKKTNTDNQSASSSSQDSLATTATTSSQSTSTTPFVTPSTSPFVLRRNMHSSEFLNRMIENAFPTKTDSLSSLSTQNKEQDGAIATNKKIIDQKRFSNKIFNEYRELNSIIPDSL